MIVFPDIQFFLYIPIYIIAILLSFFIPGDLFIKKLNLKKFERVTLAFCVGICMWALQGLIFGYLQLRNLSYAYILITLLIWLKTYRK